MKAIAKMQMHVVLAAVASLMVPSLWAADNVQAGTVVSGEITPKLYFFDYSKGIGTNGTQFLERYNYQKAAGGDNRSGPYLDLDLNIVVADAKRDVFRLERQGFGAYNHRNFLKADWDRLGLTAFYSNFRSASGGLAFLYSPNQVTGGTDLSYNLPANTNSGFVAKFNDDSGQTLFKIDRAAYGAGVALKPGLFGSTASASVNFDGYTREGNRLASYVLGGSDVSGGAARVLQRWRGFDMPVDERMDRYTVNLGGTPGGFQISYEGSLEKFDNQIRDFTIADFAAASPLLVSSSKPLHHVPDSTLISNKIRIARSFGATSLAAGYGLSVLDQDSFSQSERTSGYNSGKITTNSAYINLATRLSSGVGVDGFAKYLNRGNDSTFPAIGLINASADQQLGVRIDRIREMNYGLAANFRAPALKSTVALGWKREDKDRDLTWTNVSTVAPTLNGIQPVRSVYREVTLSDEAYVDLVSRPMPGVIFRLATSYVWADDTGLVTEPEQSLNVKSKLSYAAPSGLLLSGYYNYKNKKNANAAFADALTPAGSNGAATAQDVKKTQQAAGVSFDMPLNARVNASASLSRMQDDLETYYLSSSRRRFEAPNNAIAFIVRDRPSFNVDTNVLSLGGDWQATDALRWNGSYSYTQSKGNAASGLVQSELPTVDGTINNSVHSLALGVDYAIRKKTTLKASYVYDYYKDEVYIALTGGYHALMLGVSVGF